MIAQQQTNEDATNIITIAGVQSIASEWHEQALCGAVLHEPAQFLTCADIVTPEDFTLPLCQAFWRASTELILDGQLLDRGMIADKVAPALGMPHGDVVERIEKLLYAPGKKNNGEQYAQVIAGRAQRLRMVQALRDMEKRTLDINKPLDEIIDVANDAWFKATLTANDKPANIGASMERTIDDLKAKALLQNNTIPMGFPSLDEWSGGIKRGEVGLIVGNNGMGKTQWLLSVIRNTGKYLRDNHTEGTKQQMIAFFSLEMSEHQINQNFIQMESTVYRSRTNAPDKMTSIDWQGVNKARDEVETWHVLQFDDSKYNTVEAIKRKLRELQQAYEIVACVIDGLWKLKNPYIANTSQDTSPVAHYPHTAPAVVRMASDLNVGVWLAHQYNKDGKRHIIKNNPELWCLDGAGYATNDVQMILAIKHGVSASRDFYPIKARGLTARDEAFEMHYDSESATYEEYINVGRDTSDLPF